MNVECTYEINVNPRIAKQVDKNISDILYDIARQCLDMTYPITPRLSGKMANSSMSSGVTDVSDTHKTIGNYTSYASRVWKMNANSTNWTTPGTTSNWFNKTMETKGDVIRTNALYREKL